MYVWPSVSAERSRNCAVFLLPARFFFHLQMLKTSRDAEIKRQDTRSHWDRVCNGILYTSLRTAVKSLNESGLIIASFGNGLWRVEQIPCNFIKAGLIPPAPPPPPQYWSPAEVAGIFVTLPGLLLIHGGGLTPVSAVCRGNSSVPGLCNDPQRQLVLQSM